MWEWSLWYHKDNLLHFMNRNICTNIIKGYTCNFNFIFKPYLSLYCLWQYFGCMDLLITFLISSFSCETFSSHHWKKLQSFLSRKAEHAKNLLPASDPLYRTNISAGPTLIICMNNYTINRLCCVVFLHHLFLHKQFLVRNSMSIQSCKLYIFMI